MNRRSNSKSAKSGQLDLRLSHPLDSNRPAMRHADETIGQKTTDLNLDSPYPGCPSSSPLLDALDNCIYSVSLVHAPSLRRNPHGDARYASLALVSAHPSGMDAFFDSLFCFSVLLCPPGSCTGSARSRREMSLHRLLGGYALGDSSS
jgi:hypothetical protein